MIKKEEFERQREEQWDRVKKYLIVLGEEKRDLEVQKVVAFDMFEQGYKIAIESIGNKYQSGVDYADEEDTTDSTLIKLFDRGAVAGDNITIGESCITPNIVRISGLSGLDGNKINSGAKFKLEPNPTIYTIIRDSTLYGGGKASLMVTPGILAGVEIGTKITFLEPHMEDYIYQSEKTPDTLEEALKSEWKKNKTTS